jgi:hypothetical protein
MADPAGQRSRRWPAARFAGVALACALVAVIASVVFMSRSRHAPEVVAVDVARVTCLGKTDVLTPVVRAHPDGVDLLVETDDDGAKLAIATAGGGTLGVEFARGAQSPHAVHFRLAPGEVHVQCGSSAEVRNGVALEVVDPEGYWHEERLACARDLEERGWFPAYHPIVNPFPEAIARAVPGILPSDEISYAGYPSTRGLGGSPRIRVVRDGEVVASFDLVTYGQRRFVLSLYSCDDSRIGVPGEPTTGQLATPFELPGTNRCDPYVARCSTVYVTAASYAEARGEPAHRYTPAPMPWAACLGDQPEGCPTDPASTTLQVLLEPNDAASFVLEEGCGRSASDACG